MNTYQDVLTVTIASGGACVAYDLIDFSGAKITAADAAVLGVAKSPATGAGEQLPVIVIGVVRLKAVGGISAGAKVVSDAAGGVKTIGAGTNPFGVALQTVTDGEFVDILIR